jgi:hypothetical protein
MRAQKSKRARKFRKEPLSAGLPTLVSHPSHVPAKDWQGFVKRNPLRK